MLKITEVEKAEKSSSKLSKHPKFKKVMDEWKKGTLKSSDGKKVTEQKQAEAIAFSEVKSHLEKAIQYRKPISNKAGKYIRKYSKNGKWVYVYNNKEALKNYYKRDPILLQIKTLKKERKRMEMEMESDPDVKPEGGKAADRYGVELDRIDNKIKSLQNKLEKLNLLDIEEESDEAVPASLMKGSKQETNLEKAFSTIGTTNSGKDVYKNYNEKAYSNFTPEDHEEAATLHRNLAGKQDRTTDAGIKAYKTHMSQAKTHSMHSHSMNIYKKQEMNIEKAFSSLGLEFEEEVYFEKAEFDTESRKKLAKKGEALPDGSFPIRNKKDIKNALHDIGRANDPERAKRWIKKRAKDLGAEDLIPDEWKKDDSKDKKIEKAFNVLGFDLSKAETAEVEEESLTEPGEMSDVQLIECIKKGKGDRVRQAEKELKYRLRIKKQSENI